MEKKISEWVANLSLGEEEEVMMYIPKDEQEAAMGKWDTEKDVLKRQAMEDETRVEWKLAMMREKKKRVDAASVAMQELEHVRTLTTQLTPQVDIQRKVEIIAQSVERLARAQEQQYDFSRSAAPKGEEARPRREPVKVKFPDSYSGKREENFDNWEANVKTYVHLQQVSTDQHVLIAIHALRDEAASFARSLVRAANCNDDAVAYSSFTPLVDFMKLLLERFVDVARSVKASDKLQTIHARKWKSARAPKSTMDELVAIPDHGVTDTQLVALFYRAMPEAFRGHFFAKSEDPATMYDSLSREVVAFEAKSVSVSTFWHKDLDKGKQWKGRTISGQVKTKYSLVLTLDEGSVDEIPYDQIEWGLEEEDSGVGQGRTYAAVVAGGRPQGEGRGHGQGGRASGSRFQGDQGVGGRGGNRQAGGRGQGPPQNRPRNRSPYRALIEYPVLKVADLSLPFVVTTDASQYGIGAVLQQDDGHGYRPVEFMSARMPSEKVAASTYEGELYALRQALEHWKHYLLGRHFKVYSDHETLRWLKTQAKMTPKLTRWAAEIDQYDFELKPVKGKYNVVADALSRRADYFGAIVHYLDIGKDLQQKTREAYAQDPIYSDLLKRVKEAPKTEPNYRTTDELLFEKTNVFDRLCIPNSEEIHSLILGECHDTEGHFGWQKTLANLMHAYTWPRMKNDCVESPLCCITAYMHEEWK
ncbi:hypothetical protein CBR_g49292 [Chara braunii]|uniref:Reverse transcriptase RNase H-like domain-containing protein n=1 Tax=Chara braunii TaxID=69332 RepID=A0A388M4M2_CHABU|nr:hypothetical protein CBR_g49292 [Chara braunii]|eukprot:GBG89501.1 hypothetical protein CBR_g49292 [Chara braunii]